MDQLKNINTTSHSSNSASSTIQSAIDELSNLKSNKNSSTNTNTNTPTNTNTNNTLSSIDNTLNALDNQFPFSEHRARPHPSNITPSTATNPQKNVELARQLGSFTAPALANPLSPTGISHPYNPLTHWGSVSSLRNPYPTYGAPRNATKQTNNNTKDTNNPRKKSYEDKMDKQRLEHILFSGDQSGPLNQQKERMRQKLQKKQANKKHKKTQSLPNTTSATHSHGLLQLDAAKKQKPNGDNGYFLTEISPKSPTKPTTNYSSNTQNSNKKKKNRGNQRRGTKNQRQIKKKPNKKNQKKKKKNSNTPKKQKVNNKLDECNGAFGEESAQPNHNDYADQLPGNILNQQCDVFEQEPDEYFHDHDITPLMQNKLKLEMNQQIHGISIWRDKKELEPLLNNGGYNDYHKNENPNLLSPTDDDDKTDDDDNTDSFVDNFVNVGDSDNDAEGDVIKMLSNSNNDSDAMEIFIDPNERETISMNGDRPEPGSMAEKEYQYEGINSNVDLIKYEEKLLLNSSMTAPVDGGFDVNAEDEEKKEEDEEKKEQLIFDAKGVSPAKEVQFVEEQSDPERDLFENMNVNQQDEEGEQLQLNDAFDKVLKAASKQNKEEEREKEDHDAYKCNVGQLAAKWVKIKNDVNGQSQDEGFKIDKRNDKKKNKKKKKNNANDGKIKKNKQMPKAEKKRKVKEKEIQIQYNQNQNQNKKREKEKNNEKKRKKRAKKKKSNKAKQTPSTQENVSDDDTITVDSSSNDAQDDGGWIIKGNKNKNNKNTKRSNRVSTPTTNNVSTPVSSKSSASKKSFAYTDSMEVKPKSDTNDKHHKVNEKKKVKKHKENNKKPQIKKTKSVNSADNHHNKSQNRLKNRKERRNNNRVNRQKSDPSILSKYPSSTIVVPPRHSKTIHASMILPKSTNPATSDPLTKHNFPPLKSQIKKVHFADTSNIKRIGKAKQPNVPPVNLSVIPPPTHSTSTPTSTSTPHSIHSDSGPDVQRHHPRPTRPPITRLNQPKKESNNTPPSSNPTLASSHSETQIETPQTQTKPPLLVQRSAPLTASVSSNEMHENNDDIENNNNNNHSLIASNGANPTHMALYVDESGTFHETPLTLPDIFPAGLAPTSIPNVLGSLPAVSLTTNDSNNNKTENGEGLSNFGVIPPPQSLSFLPALTGLPPLPGGVPNVTLPLPGVSPLNTIPHSIPILLPMPQFTPQQMANLNKLNMIPKVPTATPTPIQTHKTNTNKSNTKTSLKPIVPSFKPMANKSKKLEDIKEEDEEHETMDSAPNIQQPLIQEDKIKQDIKESNQNEIDTTMRTTDSSVNIIAHFEPKSDKECLETLKNDLIEDEKEDEWIEIADLDSAVYPATLWCLHVNKWSAHPQCSLKKLQQSMASALLSS